MTFYRTTFIVRGIIARKIAFAHVQIGVHGFTMFTIVISTDECIIILLLPRSTNGP